MVSILKTNKVAKLLIYFFLANLFLKLIFIQSTPPAATYDEIIYATEAQAIVKYGTDLTGGWRPWNLAPSDSYYTELTSTVLTPGFILFPNNPILASKFVPLLLGSLLPVLLGLIAYRIKKSPVATKENVFIATSLIATLNPWIFQFSRMGYDSLFSIGFYSIGIVLLFYFKSWQKLWSIIPLFFGFYQYQGHKVLLVPLIGLVTFYLLLEKFEIKDWFKKIKNMIWDKEILSAVLVLTFSIVLTVVYLIRLPQLKSGERASEFAIYDDVAVASRVNEERRLSLDSPLTTLFTNKYTVLSRDIADRFLNSFNLQRLFIEGDRGVDTFTVLDYGFFHLIDFAVMILALAYVVRNSKEHRPLYFILGFIFIGAIPNAIRTGHPWITFRGSFAFLGIVLLMGSGIAALYDEIKLKWKFLFVPIYILATLPFFFMYFVRYPVTHAKFIGFYERVVASYVKRVGVDSSIIIVPDRADATFDYLITYNSLLTKNNQAQVNQAAQIKNFEINNIRISSSCPIDIDKIPEDTTLLVYFFKKPCEANQNISQTTEIKSLIDAGSIFTVYNDKLCSQYDLGTYPSIKKNILEVENLSDQEFCQSFFSR